MTPRERADNLVKGIHIIGLDYVWTGAPSLDPHFRMPCLYVDGYKEVLRNEIEKQIQEAINESKGESK